MKGIKKHTRRSVEKKLLKNGSFFNRLPSTVDFIGILILPLVFMLITSYAKFPYVQVNANISWTEISVILEISQ